MERKERGEENKNELGRGLPEAAGTAPGPRRRGRTTSAGRTSGISAPGAARGSPGRTPSWEDPTLTALLRLQGALPYRGALWSNGSRAFFPQWDRSPGLGKTVFSQGHPSVPRRKTSDFSVLFKGRAEAARILKGVVFLRRASKRRGPQVQGAWGGVLSLALGQGRPAVGTRVTLGASQAHGRVLITPQAWGINSYHGNARGWRPIQHPGDPHQAGFSLPVALSISRSNENRKRRARSF